MDLNHLHLHVPDLERAKAFYVRWFRFRERVRHGEDLLFLTNDDKFDFALMKDGKAGKFPKWFHFGFHLGSAKAVKSLRARMAKARVKVDPLHEEERFVSFRCYDPDGHKIEVYWE